MEEEFLLQDLAKWGAIVVRKVGGQWNPADVMTKVQSFAEMLGKLAAVHVFCGSARTGMPRGGVDST